MKMCCVIIELIFSICIIDLFNLSGKHVGMYPYLVVNITISNIDKLKIMTTVSYGPTKSTIGCHHS